MNVRRIVPGVVAVCVMGGVLTAGGASPATAAVPGLMMERETSAWDSASVKAVVAMCPSGTVLIGGGYSLGGTGTGGEVHVPEVRPVGNGIEAVAYEDENGYTPTWQVTAIAVCADPLPGLQILDDFSATTTADDKSVTVSCPSGSGVLGAGVEIDNTGELSVTSMRPTAYTGSHFVTVDVAENPSTFGGNFWNVQGYAICATL